MAPAGDSPSGRHTVDGLSSDADVALLQPSTVSAQHTNSGVRRNDKTGSQSDLSPKAQAIREACKLRRVDDLKELALSKGGFLSDSLRQQAWPVLLGLAPEDEVIDLDGPSVTDRASSWRELPRHRDEDQVQLDVDRAFVYYPNRMQILLQTLVFHLRTPSALSPANTSRPAVENPVELERRKADLSDLIVEVLRRHPYLCYFQGYHDICQVFLLVLEPAQCSLAVSRLSVLRIRDFMLPNLAPAIAQLRLLPDILDAADPALWRHLSQTEPFFALSGTLTMYAHDVQTLGEIARLFDALLALDPTFSVYVFAAIVLSRRDELFDTPDSEPEMLHSILSKLPQPLDLDALLARAAELVVRHRPDRLPAWRHVSAASVLKTARDTATCAAQSMSYGRACFDRQVRELEFAEKRDKLKAALWRYRRPARAVAFAVAFGVLAFWLRRSPGPQAYVTDLLSRWIGGH
ncbi:hypothetical protein RB601_003488 [Gaeumannomyces tritici]